MPFAVISSYHGVNVTPPPLVTSSSMPACHMARPGPLPPIPTHTPSTFIAGVNGGGVTYVGFVGKVNLPTT